MSKQKRSLSSSKNEKVSLTFECPFNQYNLVIEDNTKDTVYTNPFQQDTAIKELLSQSIFDDDDEGDFTDAINRDDNQEEEEEKCEGGQTEIENEEEEDAQGDDEDDEDDEDGEDEDARPTSTLYAFPTIPKKSQSQTQAPKKTTSLTTSSFYTPKKNEKAAFGFVLQTYDDQQTEESIISMKNTLLPISLDIYTNITQKNGILGSTLLSNTISDSVAPFNPKDIEKFTTIRHDKLTSLQHFESIYCGQLVRDEEMTSKWNREGLGFLHFQDGSTLFCNWEADAMIKPSLLLLPDGSYYVNLPITTKNISTDKFTKLKNKVNDTQVNKKQKKVSKKNTQMKDEDEDEDDDENNDSFFLQFDDEHNLVYAGYNNEEGQREGLGTFVLPDGGIMVGTWHENVFSGSNNAWYYDGKSPCEGGFIGTFIKGKMYNGKFTRFNPSTRELLPDNVGVVDNVDSNSNSIPTYLKHHNTSFVYKYDPSKGDIISSSPLQVDPWESSRVEAKPSLLPNSGDGLYARRDLKVLEIISFYNGTRPNVTEVDNRSWDDNSNTITVVDDEDTCIDVQPPYDKCESYCASLSHKANHNFDWDKVNAVFELYWHPRFGKLKIIRALKPIMKGEEIYVDYGYELSTEVERYDYLLQQNQNQSMSDDKDKDKAKMDDIKIIKSKVTKAQRIENEKLLAKDKNTLSTTLTLENGPTWWLDGLDTFMPVTGAEGRKLSAINAAQREEHTSNIRPSIVCQHIFDIPSYIIPKQIQSELKYYHLEKLYK